MLAVLFLLLVDHNVNVILLPCRRRAAFAQPYAHFLRYLALLTVLLLGRNVIALSNLLAAESALCDDCGCSWPVLALFRWIEYAGRCRIDSCCTFD